MNDMKKFFTKRYKEVVQGMCLSGARYNLSRQNSLLVGAELILILHIGTRCIVDAFHSCFLERVWSN